MQAATRVACRLLQAVREPRQGEDCRRSARRSEYADRTSNIDCPEVGALYGRTVFPGLPTPPPPMNTSKDRVCSTESLTLSSWFSVNYAPKRQVPPHIGNPPCRSPQMSAHGPSQAFDQASPTPPTIHSKASFSISKYYIGTNSKSYSQRSNLFQLIAIVTVRFRLVFGLFLVFWSKSWIRQ